MIQSKASIPGFKKRINRVYRSILSQRFVQRILVNTGSRPFISFTFDDFPYSAAINGETAIESSCSQIEKQAAIDSTIDRDTVKVPVSASIWVTA